MLLRVANRPADRLLGRLRPRRGDRPREEPAEFETASAEPFSSAEPFMSWLPEDSGSAPAAPGSRGPDAGSSRVVENEQPRDGTKSLGPPREPASSWLPDDHSGHDEEANGQRW